MRIYTATFGSIAFTTGATTIMELQVPANSSIEILRAWVGPAEGDDPIAEIQEIELYGNDAIATSGTPMTEQKIQGGGGAASGVTAILNATIAATPFNLYFDAFHTQNGWLYLPVPKEVIQIVGGSSDPGDNVGMQFPVAPDQTMTFSGGMTWAELS